MEMKIGSARYKNRCQEWVGIEEEEDEEEEERENAVVGGVRRERAEKREVVDLPDGHHVGHFCACHAPMRLVHSISEHKKTLGPLDL